MPSFAQGNPIAMTGKIASLDGLWIHDQTKGILGSCGNTIDQTIRIGVSAQGVTFESRRLAGLMRFDGSPTTMTGLGNFNGVASAGLDAGWLTITTRRARAGATGGTGVLHDVYIVDGDELRIWRTFNLELPDGSLSQNVCGNRQALVYHRQRQP
jgi:hypothetical protein